MMKLERAAGDVETESGALPDADTSALPEQVIVMNWTRRTTGRGAAYVALLGTRPNPA